MALIRPVQSIRLKIGLVFGITFFLGFAGAATYVFYEVKKVLIQQENRSLTDRATRLSERTSLYPLVIPLPDRGEVISLWYTTGGVARRLYQSPTFPASAPNLGSKAVFQSDTFQLARYVRSVEGGYGKLTTVVGHSNQPLAHQLLSIGWLLISSLLLSMILSGLGAWWLSGWLLQPLKTIIKSARSVNLADEVTPIPTPNSNDELQELADTINDMLARIRQAIDTQHNFFAAASHELRTPLSILRTEIEVAQREATQDEDRRFLASQLSELRRLSRLVDDLLAMSQLRAGTLQLRPEPIELDDLTLHLMERYHSSINQRQLYLAIHLDDTTPSFTIQADLDKLTNVLLNLLDNAVKYAQPNTQLDLRISTDNELIIWSITNLTNVPIPDPDRLTREFYQVDSRHDGYGLGLWISHQIIRLMGGSLTLAAKDNTFRAEISFKKAKANFN
ncbi:HAMP domain-containing sensor histidine kinase [Siphonobacter sp. SORGH_AS_1065]|uniref:HAMP domain-containing sensor histidine kinase n=1 Tax=Siphonobacter sp. SORGH_AS_1065 TaxID=3041795 RepID=UPI0027843DCF|nr:HAMP domain-containing sensor histidine kinase [Siphonobacter sp. SORGH_AS_1065]MDQ1090412.1 signal transduction histidine kinase [Siphonobacter sp. SORGH_AS_1065]